MDRLEGTIQQVLAEGMAAVQQTLVEKFVEKIGEDTRRNQEAVDAATVRPEGRIDRLREEP